MNETQLENLLIKHGFTDFQWLKPERIHVYQWVRFKCRFGCSSYGKSATCPPNLPSITDCREFVAEYRHVLIVHISKVLAKPEDYRAWSNDLTRRMYKLEQEVFLAGYYKAFLLPANMCTLCNSCSVNRTDCKNPIMSRPCAEAVGIDVYAAAREVGYPIEVLRDHRQAMNRYAFLLVE